MLWVYSKQRFTLYSCTGFRYISVSDADSQLCFPGRPRLVCVKYFNNTIQLTLQPMHLLYHGKLAWKDRCYIFQMNLQIMVRSYIISQLSNRTILRCSPPTSYYLYENGKTANSQHPTGKNPSSHVTSHHLSAPEFIQRTLYCVYYH